jgi:hypothetical protein
LQIFYKRKGRKTSFLRVSIFFDFRKRADSSAGKESATSDEARIWRRGELFDKLDKLGLEKV